MRNPASQRWPNGRLSHLSQTRGCTPSVVTNRLSTPAQSPAESVPETPGPDGIRWGLVNRVRAEIAAGAYDTPERWLQAEELLLNHIENDC